MYYYDIFCVAIIQGAVGYSHRHKPCFDGVKGAVYLFNMNTPKKPIIKLKIEGMNTKDFNPVGISHYKDEENEGKLQAVQKNAVFKLDSHFSFLTLCRWMIIMIKPCAAGKYV